MSKPEIKYFDDLFSMNVVSLVWANEIHIEKKYQNSPHLDKIIAHEKRHKKYFEEYLSKTSQVAKFLTIMKNNIWDALSCYKLNYYLDFRYFLAQTIIVGSLILYIGVDLL